MLPEERNRYEQRLASIIKLLHEIPTEILDRLILNQYTSPNRGILYTRAKEGNITSSLSYRSGGLIATYTPAEGMVIGVGFPCPTKDYIFINSRICISEENLRFLESIPGYFRGELSKAELEVLKPSIQHSKKDKAKVYKIKRRSRRIRPKEAIENGQLLLPGFEMLI